ncbi:DUF6705 family protein [Chryseobacterium lineare]
MKNTIFKTFLSIVLMSNFLCCKAQQYPLNTDYDDIANNSYLKDLNNELDPYIGVYKANYNGKEIILYITKVNNKLEKRPNKVFYRDVLIIKYIVKNSSGTTLQDTQNNNLQTNRISSFRIRSYDSTVLLSYEGTNCRVGCGTILLKKIKCYSNFLAV